MTSTLVHLPLPSRPLDADALHSARVPAAESGPARLQAALDQQALGHDARAIWIGYPNLERASLALVEQLSADWPCRGEAGASAAIQAVARAIREVCRGLERREGSREQVTANFLQGLASAAADTASTVAWGFRGQAQVEPFELWSGSFERWCRLNALTQVRFYRSCVPSSWETEGMRLKLLCAVASSRDVGIASRWRTTS